jgi:hypothetical protein
MEFFFLLSTAGFFRIPFGQVGFCHSVVKSLFARDKNTDSRACLERDSNRVVTCLRAD